ncbi:ArsR/SmtB family transcription factor [Armatimonas rosea]|uniref:ArsR family transcriptional regulator n=1 Tax=Armatimonas rosea TaxID=685828 RepID=A0A7W9W5V8_ARMRO|nr:metalloregulator ArsR/SmtB family transcription factor [Armatimonas rosea]MBB6049350.1 ArsR family transcriptional regulator [Armatimonas rosea]
MTDEQLTTAFKALGDPTRLAIFQCLRDCCPTAAIEEDGGIRPTVGPTVGEVCCKITGAEKITSTVSAHLKELRLAGLITMEKRGKFVVCALNPSTVAALAAFLGEKPHGCC